MMIRNAILVPWVAMAMVAQVDPSIHSAAEIANLVVKNIDEHYLYARNPPWKKVRAEISRATVPDGDPIYVPIRHRLAELRDSELHLVSASELSAIQGESEGKAVGTGLMEFSIDVVPQTGEARIVTPLVGSPAATAGLLPRDIIVAVKETPTRKLDHEQVLGYLRSPAGADLLIRRAKRSFRVHVAPSAAPLNPITSELLSSKNGTVAYLRILQFTHSAADIVRSTIVKFDPEKPRGYVLDLRNNPGGFLDVAIRVSSFFISGPLGNKIRQNGDTEPITADGVPLTGAPLVVLVNEGTASAAEFVAGALQGRCRAVIVGVPTYGRGQAQVYQRLSDEYGLIIPSALIQTPDKRRFKGAGLMPDVRIAGSAVVKAELDLANDPQLLGAIELLSKEER